MPTYDRASGRYWLLAFGEIRWFATLKDFERWLANVRILGH